MSVTAPLEATRTAVPVRPAFTANDRCDRCGAQAYVAVDMKGFELLFCAHHSREHGPALLVQGAHVTRDETTKLEEGNRQQGADHA